MNNMADGTFALTLSVIDALRGLDPESELWRASLRRARRQDPRVAAFLQFAHTASNNVVEERRTFVPLPFSPLPERPQRGQQRKRLSRYAVRLWLVGVPTADAPGWRKKRA